LEIVGSSSTEEKYKPLNKDLPLKVLLSELSFVDRFDIFEFEYLLETANVPVLHGVDGRHP